MAGLRFDNAMPRIISSRTHSWIDYIHAGTNLLFAALFFKRNKRAAAGALLLGSSVIANALMTDYERGVFRLYSFKVHGMLDYGVAALSSAWPAITNTTDTPEAKYFYGQGIAEKLIAGITDYTDNSGATRIGARIEDRFLKHRAA